MYSARAVPAPPRCLSIQHLLREAGSMPVTGRTKPHPHDDAPDTTADFERLTALPDGPERKALRDEVVELWLTHGGTHR
ncbi:hypothetical protein SALBM311S_02510 [Streptomyces alboniger]